MEKMTLGLFISNRRKNLGLSQKEIADFLAVSIPTVSKWEKDERIPDLSLFNGLAKILKVDLESLLEFKEELNNNYDLENEFNIDEFSKHFAALRKLSGYTLITLAEKLDISYQTISKWERSESVPNIFVLKKCAEIFNVSLIELYYGKSFNTDNKSVEKDKDIKKSHTFLYLIPTLIGCLTVFIGAFIAFNNVNNNDNNESISNNINLDNSSLISESENVSSEIYDDFDFEEVVANLSFEDESFSYDGNLHSIYVNGEIPNGVSISYENNDHIQEGDYEVIATISNDVSNYDMSITMKATLSIVKDGKYHDVCFELLDGTYQKQVIENECSIISFPYASKKEGYSFDKWINKNNNETINESFKITSDTTIIASYVPNTYKVSYYYGENLIKEEEAIYDSNYTFLSAYENENEELLINLTINGEQIEPGTTQVFKYSSDISIQTTFVPTNSDFQYEISNGEKKLVKYLGNKKNVVIPNGVTSICNLAFAHNEKIENIIIPNSVITIEQHAITSCENLKTIKLANSVLNITGQCIYECPYVVIYCEAESQPSGWSDMWKHSSTPVYWGINENNFINELGVDYVIFDNYAVVSKVIIEKEEVHIPKSIKMNGKDYPVKKVGSYSFAFCKNIEKVFLEDNIETIIDLAFFECDKLLEVKLSENLIEIEGLAFLRCISLLSVKIPSKVSTIGSTAFNECSNLETIIVDEKNTIYDSRQNCNAIIESDTDTLLFGCKETTIPNDVVKIGDAAFYGRENLLQISFPESVKEIGMCAFYESGLQEVTIPGTVEIIKERAFFHCLNLGRVKVESGVKTIETEAFGCCFSLYSASISNGVEMIEKNIFNQCSYLGLLEIPITKEVYESKVGIGYYIDEDIFLSDTASVPVDLYRVKINGGIIKSDTFKDLSCIKEIIIGKDVEAIEYLYFQQSLTRYVYFECNKGEEPSSYQPGGSFIVFYNGEWICNEYGVIERKPFKMDAVDINYAKLINETTIEIGLNKNCENAIKYEIEIYINNIYTKKISVSCTSDLIYIINLDKKIDPTKSLAIIIKAIGDGINFSESSDRVKLSVEK